MMLFGYGRHVRESLARIECAIDELHDDVRQIQFMEVMNMALGQDILDAVTAETTVLDSFIALVDGLVKNNTIPTATGDAIKAAIAANKAKIDAAIIANTPAAP